MIKKFLIFFLFLSIPSYALDLDELNLSQQDKIEIELLKLIHDELSSGLEFCKLAIKATHNFPYTIEFFVDISAFDFDDYYMGKWHSLKLGPIRPNKKAIEETSNILNAFSCAEIKNIHVKIYYIDINGESMFNSSSLKIQEADFIENHIDLVSINNIEFSSQ